MKCPHCGNNIAPANATSDSGLVFRFGKYKGISIDHVPASYLLWLRKQDWFAEQNQEFADYVEKNIEILTAAAEDER